ncbi:metalloprotease [Haladaptatus sp. DFWS20]|uniref:metalloprotease n=1 Tax=Haladaptatus sp. DFWS20 TaxID=3403467 RepID=UPI003EC0130A
MNVRFSAHEIRDLLIAWIALGIAFTLFLQPELVQSLIQPGGGASPGTFIRALGISLLTAGVGFLLHELAHKVMAIRFGQIAEFRADYGMLFLAIVSALAGFLFAAPGAVYHRGMATKRENGLIALAGPVTNVALGAVFFPIWLLAPENTFVNLVGHLGVQINFLLAGFNMLPWGPLDGKKVQSWSTIVFVGTFVPLLLLAVYALLFMPFPRF